MEAALITVGGKPAAADEASIRKFLDAGTPFLLAVPGHRAPRTVPGAPEPGQKNCQKQDAGWRRRRRWAIAGDRHDLSAVDVLDRFFGQDFGVLVDNITGWQAFVGLGFGLELLAMVVLLAMFWMRGWIGPEAAGPNAKALRDGGPR